MDIIFRQLFVLYFFLLIGWAFGKRRPDLQPQTGLLSFLLVNLFLPSKVFGAFARNFTLSFLRQHSTTVLVSLSLLAALIVASFFVARLLAKDAQKQKLYRYSLTISNYAYVGYALAEGIFGPMALTNLIMFCFPFIVYANGFGYVMFTGDRFAAKRLINPAVIAIVCGAVFGLCGWQVPSLLEPILSFLSDGMGPLSMMMTGIVLSGFSLRYLRGDGATYLAVFLRLLVIPAAILALFSLPCLQALRPTAVLMACMPCPINPVLLARMTGRDCGDAVRLILLSMAGAAATLPFWLWVLMQL